jgi:serine/threonine protein kinase
LCSHRQFRQAFEEAGICHGDIAARNVLRSPDRRLRLVDFGISTLMKKQRPLTGKKFPTLSFIHQTSVD